MFIIFDMESKILKFLVLTDIHDTWVFLHKMLLLAGEMDGVIFLGDLMTFRKVNLDSFTNFAKIKDASNWLVGVPGNGPLPKVREYFDELGINLHCKGRTIDDIGFFGVGGVQETLGTISELREFFKNEDTSSITPNDRELETLNTFGIFFENNRFAVEDWTEARMNDMEMYTSPFEHTEERIYEILSNAFKEIEQTTTQILVSHVPPFESGIASSSPIGVSTGSKGISKFILEKNPTLSISGHSHRHHEFVIGKTRCITFPAAMNGFYGILSIEQQRNEIETSIHTF
ncbi:MAG: metallophosphoesterase [Candidatus Thorarchaeota archaeon]